MAPFLLCLNTALLYLCLLLTGHSKQMFGIGGWKKDSKTGILGVWDKKLQRWCHPYPPMPTARSGAAVVTLEDRWPTVAGGTCKSGKSEVEIFDITTRHWYRSAPLPIPLYHMSSVTMGNTWYLLGGYGAEPSKQVICASLDDIISQAVSKPSTRSAALWQVIAPTPLIRSTALVLNGSLLAVGGDGGSSAIYLYQPKSKCWIRAGELPNDRAECACTVLPCGKFVVLGGNVLQSIDIGALNY